MGMGFVVGILGVLIISHAAYCTIQYRAVLKITEEELSRPPINVVMELILGLILCSWAALTVLGKFLSILPDSLENSCMHCLEVAFLLFLVLITLKALIGGKTLLGLPISLF
ncbi:unnamed protein product [Ilex paraguariensis]|uniref:Membrane magnesium transporter n=1 Tax=Ilex paraguariensis TaxID=185542 RepID=A0ABC8UNI9_9AQUA